MAQSPFLEVSSEFQPELTDIQRKQKLAELLTQRGMQAPQGQVVSGRYVAANPLEYVSNLFNVYSGQNLQSEQEKRQQELAKAIRQKGVEEATDIMNALSGTSNVATYGAGEEGPTRTISQVTDATKASPQAALAKALAAETSAGRALLPSVMERAMPKDFDLEEGKIRYRTNPATGKIEEVARGGDKKTEQMRNFEFAKSQGYAGSFDDYQNRMTPYQKAELEIQRARLANDVNKLPEGAANQVTGAVNLQSSIKDYKEKLDKFKTLDMANPTARASINTAYRDMILQAKEAYKLGVLNGNDYQILTSIVQDPTAPSALLVNKDTLKKQAEDLEKKTANIVSNVYKVHGKQVPNYLQSPATPTPPANSNVVDFNSLK